MYWHRVCRKRLLKILRKRGTYIQSGLSVGQIKVNPFDWAFKDLRIIGVWCFNTYDFPKTLELMATGQFPVKELVTNVISVEDIVEKGFEVLTGDDLGKEMKIQVSFENWKR